MHKSSYFPLGFDNDFPIFNQYSDKEEKLRFMKTLLQQKIFLIMIKRLVKATTNRISTFSWNNNKGRYLFGALLTLLLTTWSL
jgi:hypothetical protein